MIYLFDNCYLSTTNQIVETCTQVWIGSHSKLDDPYLSRTYDIYKTYKTITKNQLDSLLNDIHENMSDKKVILYCDIKYYQFVYSSFFGSFLSKEGVKQLYLYDKIKENYNIGSKLYGMAVTGFKNTESVSLPEELTISPALTFKSDSYRLEIAYANFVAGNEEYKDYCINKVCDMYDGSTGFFSSYIEQNLPAVLEDSQYTIANILNDNFISNVVSEYSTNEIIPRDIVSLLKEKFNYDHFAHFANTMNNNNLDEQERKRISDDVCSLTKEQYVEKYLIDPEQAIKFQLIFPNLSNFDSINPILWNKILENQNDSEWLSKFEVIDGTDNQTDGTV
jgi:hypothetical protein